MAVKNLYSEDISDYEFFDFDENILDSKKSIKEYDRDNFNEFEVVDRETHEKNIKSEREFAEKERFEISSIVKDHRGIKAQEEKNLQDKIQERVDIEVKDIKDEAFKSGYEDGLKYGKNEIYEKMKESSADKIEKLTEIISELMEEKKILLQKEKMEIYRLIKNLVKWIVLRELKDDGDYIKRLIDKLIADIGDKQKILVQVGKDQFDHMSDIREFIRNEIEELENVRVEVDYDISGNGVVVESQNTIIKGTLEEQFNSLDKLFESVGLPGDSRRKKS